MNINKLNSLVELYFKKTEEVSGKKPFLPEGVGIQMLDAEGTIFVTIQLKDMIMNNVGALDLNFSSNTIEFETFEIEFTYNILDIAVNIT